MAIADAVGRLESLRASPLHRQYPSRVSTHLTRSTLSDPSQYQSHHLSSPRHRSFHLDPHSGSTRPQESLTICDPLISRHSMSPAQRKAALAGVFHLHPAIAFIVLLMWRTNFPLVRMNRRASPQFPTGAAPCPTWPGLSPTLSNAASFRISHTLVLFEGL